eukprot:sb/3473607/
MDTERNLLLRMMLKQILLHIFHIDLCQYGPRCHISVKFALDSYVTALASAKVTLHHAPPAARARKQSTVIQKGKSLSLLVLEIQHRARSNKCPGSIYLSIYLWIDAVFTKFIIIFDAKRHKIDTSRLLHSKDNRLNCVVEWFLFSRSN